MFLFLFPFSFWTPLHIFSSYTFQIAWLHRKLSNVEWAKYWKKLHPWSFHENPHYVDSNRNSALNLSLLFFLKFNWFRWVFLKWSDKQAQVVHCDRQRGNQKGFSHNKKFGCRKAWSASIFLLQFSCCINLKPKISLLLLSGQEGNKTLQGSMELFHMEKPYHCDVPSKGSPNHCDPIGGHSFTLDWSIFKLYFRIDSLWNTCGVNNVFNMVVQCQMPVVTKRGFLFRPDFTGCSFPLLSLSHHWFLLFSLPFTKWRMNKLFYWVVL